MSTEDKLKNEAEKVKGAAKEAAGKLTGNESLEREGELDRTKGDLKQSGENIKDAFKE